MHILARPAFKSRSGNPYNYWLLYTSIKDCAVYVDESSPIQSF
jgi:hypothetical protein